LFDERVALVEFELTVRLEGAFEGAIEAAVVMLGVIVMDELREVIYEGFIKWPGRKVPPSDDEEASFPKEEAVVAVLSRKSWTKKGPHRRARRYELTEIRSPPIATRSISARSRRFIAMRPRSIAALGNGRAIDVVLRETDGGRTGALIEG